MAMSENRQSGLNLKQERSICLKKLLPYKCMFKFLAVFSFATLLLSCSKGMVDIKIYNATECYFRVLADGSFLTNIAPSAEYKCQVEDGAELEAEGYSGFCPVAFPRGKTARDGMTWNITNMAK